MTTTSPFDTSEHRAALLVPQIQAILAQTGKAKVNLIGHSQGGMDARVLASPNGFAMGDQIASVTTIATPNHGTLLADAAANVLSVMPQSLDAVVGDMADGFFTIIEETAYTVQTNPNLLAQITEMSQANMEAVFNPKYVDDPRVVYASYAGRTILDPGLSACASAVYPNDPSQLDAAQPELAATAALLQIGSGTNDGLVSVASAQWGTFMQCVPADHLTEVGLFDGPGPQPLSDWDHLAFFRDVVSRLRAQGF